MPQKRQGAFHLFRVAGIDVFLHWSWFAVVFYEIRARGQQWGREYSSPVFCILEALGLWSIVLLHEFGHSLACQSVGGKADEIMLWPLGGAAYVSPPERPGATLWSIAAGPLVNVVLCPLLLVLSFASSATGFAAAQPDVHELLSALLYINTSLLIFNILPIYPLDGGQILRSILWFFVGRARSLQIATAVGFVGVAGIVVFAVWVKSIWLGLIAAFAFGKCQQGWRYAKALSKIAAIPRRHGFACPSCTTPPPLGEFWTCQHCQARFDLFLHQGLCPHCDARYETMQCLDCKAVYPFADWIEAGTKDPALAN